MKLDELRKRFRPSETGSVEVGGGKRVAYEIPQPERLEEHHWALLKRIFEATRERGGMLARYLRASERMEAGVLARAGFINVEQHIEPKDGSDGGPLVAKRLDGIVFICRPEGEKALRARKLLAPNEPDLNNEVHVGQTMSGDPFDFDSDDPFNDHW